MSESEVNSMTKDKQRTNDPSSEFGSELSNFSTNQFEHVFSRMMKAVGTNKAADVAEALGISQSSVSGSKRRGNIPDSWYAIIADKFGVSIDWLRTGDGEMMRGASPMGQQEREGLVKRTVEKLHGWSPPAASQAETAPATATIYNDCEKPESNIADLVSKTIEVLQSRTVFQTALESNIEAFHHAIVLDKKIDQVEERIMRNVSARLDALEAENKQAHAENQQLRQELEQSRAQSTLSDTG